MDWKTLYLTADGRIGQRDFWLGFLILFVAGFVLGMIPIIGAIVGIALIYPNVCLYSKRLHDFGRSGWLAAVPYAVACIGFVLMMMMGGMSAIGAMMGGSSNAMAGASMMAGFGAMGIIGLLMFLFLIGFLLWVGLTKGDPGENRYGAPGRQLIGGATATPVP